jgi:hypothetical protein
VSKPPPRNVFPLPLRGKQNPLGTMPADFRDDAYQTRAWCVAIFDSSSGRLLRASIFSSPARGLTQHLREECLLEGPSGMGTTYAEARAAVEKTLKELPCYRWLWRAVRDYDAKTGLSRV